jgi:DNA-binding response OmpR family regulator
MSGSLSVVVVEDEPDLLEAVVEYLGEAGLDVRGVGDGRSLRQALGERPASVVVLDIALPGEDGLSLCRWARRETGAGVIMATAAGQPLDRVVGLELGADDYLVKPYELRELLARIRSVARRLERAPAAAATEPLRPAAPTRADGAQPFGPLRLDRRARRLTDEEGAEIKLTATEFTMLLVFADRPNRVLSRGQLAELVHGRTHDPDDRSIDIAMARLRKKIERDPALPQIIRTVRGEGYRFDADAD